jgi:hypothetical protein
MEIVLLESSGKRCFGRLYALAEVEVVTVTVAVT